MTEISIRDAVPGDRDVIAGYNAALATDTENKRLDAATLKQGVAALLADPAKGRYFLAVKDGKVVGQTMITYEWSDWRNGAFWWIQSVYVHPEHRAAGVFGKLYRHIAALAENDPGVCGIRLYVDKHNRDAARIYRHLGLEVAYYDLLERDFVLQGGQHA